MTQTLTSLSIQSTSQTSPSILQPQRQNRFRIQFVDQFNNTIEDTEVLSTQLVSVDAISLSLNSINTEGVTSIMFQQDEGATAVAVLCNMMEDETRCDILIDYLDGNDHVTRSHRLVGVRVTRLFMSELDYASSDAATVRAALWFAGSYLSF